MNSENYKPTNLHRPSWMLGLTLLTLSSLSYVEPAKASSLACATGANWVSTCQSGIYKFQNTVTNFINLFSPNNQPDFQITRFGSSSILLGNPVDAIIDDPVLGNIGTLDGNLDVIQFEIFSSISTGDTPNPIILATFKAGDGVPDLAPTPADATLPYESLYTTGAIIQRQDDPTLADSVLKLFLEVQDRPEGALRNGVVISATAEVPLTGFPSEVAYISRDVTPLLTGGADGVFWTGDEVEFDRIVPGPDGFAAKFELRIESVPEPSTVFSSLLIGLGIVFGSKKGKSSN